jgi:hypothetical protein
MTMNFSLQRYPVNSTALRAHFNSQMHPLLNTGRLLLHNYSLRAFYSWVGDIAQTYVLMRVRRRITSRDRLVMNVYVFAVPIAVELDDTPFSPMENDVPWSLEVLT